MEKHVEED